MGQWIENVFLCDRCRERTTVPVSKQPEGWSAVYAVGPPLAGPEDRRILCAKCTTEFEAFMSVETPAVGACTSDCSIPYPHARDVHKGTWGGAVKIDFLAWRKDRAEDAKAYPGGAAWQIVALCDELVRWQYNGAGGGCRATSDGECTWTACPQKRDFEPANSGRHCPLDTRTDEEA